MMMHKRKDGKERIGILAIGSVDCWFFETDRFVADELLTVLSADECERAAHFVFKRDRTDFIICRAVLRHLLSAYLNAQPAFLRFKYGPAGKPSLSCDSDVDLSFNLAHSHGMGLIGVSKSAQLGIDIERVRPLPDIAALVASHFAAQEREAFAALPADHQLRAFYAGWTRKEAVLKATGEGLTRSPCSFAVTLAPGEAPALLLTNQKIAQEEWTIADISPDSALTAAVAIRRRNARVRTATLEPELLRLTTRRDSGTPQSS